MDLLRTLRPHQWLKNAFVFVPLVFARHLFTWGDALRALAAFGLFCLVAGSVYIVNDVMDLEVDRAHPTKRNRPLASGRLAVRDALASLAILVAAGLGGLACLSWQAAALAGVYFVLNVAYSRWLKHLVFVDLATIAAGFLIRVLVGAWVIAVPVTPWVLALTFLLAFYLGLGKRRHELVLLQDSGEARRKVLEAYSLRHLDWSMVACAVAIALAFAAWTQAPATLDKFGTRNLGFTVIFIIFGLYRFRRLMLRTDSPESPTDAMLHDVPFLANLGLWVATVLLILYAGALGGSSTQVTPGPAAPMAASAGQRGQAAEGARSRQPRQIPAPEGQPISLGVKSVPLGGRVYLDGELLGVTPLLKEVPSSPRQRHLEVRADGFLVREMDLVLDRNLTMGLMLEKPK
jgi:4-hydroxybenzoate polyprenyltransferase